jgi:hypothetical protein
MVAKKPNDPPTVRCAVVKIKARLATVSVTPQGWKKFIDRHRYKNSYRYLKLVERTLDGPRIHVLSDASIEKEGLAPKSSSIFHIVFKFRRVNTVYPQAHTNRMVMWP